MVVLAQLPASHDGPDGPELKGARKDADPFQPEDTSMAVSPVASGDRSSARDLLPPPASAARMGSYPRRVGAEALGAEARQRLLTGKQEKQSVRTCTGPGARKATPAPINPQVSAQETPEGRADPRRVPARGWAASPPQTQEVPLLLPMLVTLSALCPPDPCPAGERKPWLRCLG